MLGQDLVAALEGAGHEVRGVDRQEFDVTDPSAVSEAVAGLRPDVVVNCAAWTAVDAAEEQEAAAFQVSAVGAANIGRAARTVGARLVQVSTDYVFDGHATSPYVAGAPLLPASAYGRTKAAGEWAARAECPDTLVVRTAWLYGARGNCFPKTIAAVAAKNGHVDVVDDQHGQPTWTVDVSRIIIDLIERSAPAGAYHATSSGECSWYEFARAVVAADGQDPEKVGATTSADFVRPAPRPAYSVLDHASVRAAGVDPIGDWRERWAGAAGTVLG